MKQISDIREDKALEAAHKKLVDLESGVRAAIAEYGAALKAAAKAGWPDDLTEAAEHSRTTAEAIHQEIAAEVARVEEYLLCEYGISLAELDKETRQRFDSRFWKAQLSPTVMKATGLIEDALAQGLDALLALIPPKWIRAQDKLCRNELGHRN